MTNPFKNEETRPLNAPVIEMRKSSRNYMWWVIGAILIVLTLAVLVKM